MLYLFDCGFAAFPSQFPVLSQTIHQRQNTKINIVRLVTAPRKMCDAWKPRGSLRAGVATARIVPATKFFEHSLSMFAKQAIQNFQTFPTLQ